MAELNEAKISKFLGIDYGESKVGLAIADSETRMAFALKTLANDKNMLQNITEIIERENISKVIIGVASHINKKQVIYPGEKLGNLLADKLKINVDYEDEMFTTKQAYQNLIEKGMKGIKRYDDQEAARIILQSWLDRKSRNI
ncbi:MAG: Holliday junction resolvase RuvX [Parcubacteria group bacterium]|jgi:putative Holliday junction resolvase